jgi:hypothetical protein
MKKHYSILCLLLVGLACTKQYDDQFVLETRGNDNHKIWRLSGFSGDWNYSLSDGTTGTGSQTYEGIYSCERPYGRIIETSDVFYDNGDMVGEIGRSMVYNDNFMIDTETSDEFGDEVIRKYKYDAQGQWIGVEKTVNGEIVDEAFEFLPGGLVKTYTSDGVRLEFKWRANNVREVRTYVQPEESMSRIQRSLVFDRIGMNEKMNQAAKKHILKAYESLQPKSKAGYRSKQTDEWVLVSIEEWKTDPRVIQPYSSEAKGYPGSASAGGFYNLPKNFIYQVDLFAATEDGKPGDMIYHFLYENYKTKDNLPVSGTYVYTVPVYDVDANEDAISYEEHGNGNWFYTSGCNQILNPGFTPNNNPIK